MDAELGEERGEGNEGFGAEAEGAGGSGSSVIHSSEVNKIKKKEHSLSIKVQMSSL